MQKPQRPILTIWRIVLSLIALFPAFVTSLLFPTGSRLWIGGTIFWVVAFLFFYLFYLPVRYRSLRYILHHNRLEVHSGVFYRRARSMPLANIQFVGLLVSPLDAHWGLATVIVTAAGGRLVLPGLARKDAESLVAILKSE